MRTRVSALACAGLWVLAACTSPTPGPSATPTPARSELPSAASPAPGRGSPTPDRPSASASASGTASALVLSGTSIGGERLGRATVGQVEPELRRRLGEPTLGRPQLCRSETDRAGLVAVDHTWPGLAVTYASSGGTARAIAWSVDLTRLPDGVELAGGYPWRPTFDSLDRLPGITVGHSSGRRTATLPRQHLAWSGPLGEDRPDRLGGGTALACD